MDRIDIQNKMFTKGFIPYEVNAFLDAKTPDGKEQDWQAVFDSAPFQAMIRSREVWVLSLKKMGYTPKQIVGAIKSYYTQKSGRSPFDFLKAEYRPPAPLTDYQFAIRARARAKIDKSSKKHVGIRYTAWKGERK